jgi:DNA-binding CsgD family transcriptional regulator
LVEQQAAAEDERTAVGIRSPRITGRDTDLARVIEAMSRAPSLLLVEGEAGIGKSRLVLDALASEPVRGKRSLVAVCPSFIQASTLGPIVDMLRRVCDGVAELGLSPLAGALRPFFPEWVEDLPPVPEPLSSPGAVRHRLIRASAELLEHLGTDVLVVEDVHWADEATLDFLLFLVSQASRPISLVLTYRPEDLPSGSPLLRLSSRRFSGVAHIRIGLAPLTVSETARLVSSMLDDEDVSPAFAAFLHEHTGGVPLAVEECVRLMHDRADLVWSNSEWVRRRLTDITVPPTIRDAVAERAARLSPAAQEILHAAAVLAVAAEDSAIASVAGLQGRQALDAVSEAVRSRLLGEDSAGRIEFRHALAARAVHDQLPAADRRRLHRRAALALEGVTPPPVTRLAHHFREAQDRAQWWHYAEQAADLALAAGMHQSATTLLHQMLDDPELPAKAVARLTAKMPALAGYAGLDQLVRTLRVTLADKPLSVQDRAAVRSQLGRMLLHAGEYAAGVAEFERALPDLSHDPGTAVQAMMVLSLPNTSMLTVSEHLRWLDRADALLTAFPFSEAERLLFLGDRIMTLLEAGQESGWEQAELLPAQAVTQAEKLQLTRISMNTGSVAVRWGRFAQARARLDRALELASLHGYGRIEKMTLGTLLHLDWCTGQWERLSERAGALAEYREEPQVHLEAVLVSGLHDAANGRRHDAESALQTVLREGTRLGIMEMPLEPAAALARLRLADGNLAEALELTEAPMRVVASKELWLWGGSIAPVRVDALVKAGHLTEAQQLVNTFEEGLGGLDAPGPLAALDACRASLAEGMGQVAESVGYWAAAADSYASLPRPYDALRSRERQAFGLLSTGEQAMGHSTLADVRRGYSALGAEGDAQRLDRTLRSLDGSARPGRRGYGGELSPRELQVLRLMLAGLTNPEIAQELFRSPKTVAAQLNSVMRKYGATSRTVLAVRATQAGIEPAER